MSVYTIERREVGWPRYRVIADRGSSGEPQPRRVIGEFLTRRSAERWIASTRWKPVTKPRPSP